MNKELNLIPQINDSVKEGKKRKANAILGIIGLVLMVILSFGYTFGKEVYLGIKEKKLQAEVALNVDLIAKEEELQGSIIRTRDHIEKAKSLSTIKSKKTDEIFVKLQNEFPSTIKLTNLMYKGVGFSATGVSSSKEDIEVLWANLRESSEFKNSYISSIKKDDKTSLFEFTLEVALLSGGVDNEGK
ncbi:PilN domain-containing protein [Clostridium paraputrificum]|uniref:PilN domain-containing protein n=1 Tax=Clostridium paraputrificum TaxID=29363 RepID=UPI003D33C410